MFQSKDSRENITRFLTKRPKGWSLLMLKSKSKSSCVWSVRRWRFEERWKFYVFVSPWNKGCKRIRVHDTI